MAYINQEIKKAKTHKLKAVFKKYGIKATVSVENHSVLKVNIWSSPLDFIGKFNKHQIKLGSGTPARAYLTLGAADIDSFGGLERSALKDIIAIANSGNYNNSDTMTDYYNVGFYLDINIGKYGKPYIKLAA